MKCTKAEHAIQRTPNWQSWTDSNNTHKRTSVSAREGVQNCACVYVRVQVCVCKWKVNTKKEEKHIAFIHWTINNDKIYQMTKNFLDFLSINKLITTFIESVVILWWRKNCIPPAYMDRIMDALTCPMQSNPMVKEMLTSIFISSSSHSDGSMSIAFTMYSSYD